MALVDRLEAAAKYHDSQVWLGGYNQTEADARDLLEEASKTITEHEAESERLLYALGEMQFGGDKPRDD